MSSGRAGRARAVSSRWVRLTMMTAAALVMLSAFPSEARRRVTASELGDGWPLTVREGEIDCIPGPQVRDMRVDAVVFRAGGKTYALNGAARQRAKERGYAAIEPIWRPDPKMPQLRVSITSLIALALKECP
jgi:hypothetical protein